MFQIQQQSTVLVPPASRQQKSTKFLRAPFAHSWVLQTEFLAEALYVFLSQHTTHTSTQKVHKTPNFLSFLDDRKSKTDILHLGLTFCLGKVCKEKCLSKDK